MDSYNTYKHINYTLAPSGNYVGWTFYENGIYYASHRTLELMAKGVKHQLYLQKKVSTRGYTLANKPTPKEDVPISRMKQAFLTRAYWGNKTVDKLTPEQQRFREKYKDTVKQELPATDEIKYDYYDYRQEGNKLVVIGCKKIAEYNLEKPNEPVEKPSLNGTLHLPDLD